MSEKKTFKVDGRLLGRDYNGFGWIVAGVDTVVTKGVNHFDDDEWDMEVTFTKKEKPLAVGDKIRDSQGDTAVILAIDGDKVWLKYYGKYDFRATGNLDECTKL